MQVTTSSSGRPRGIVHGDVVGGEQRHAETVGELAAAQQVAAWAAAITHHGADPQPSGAGRGEPCKAIVAFGAWRGKGGPTRASDAWLAVIEGSVGFGEGGWTLVEVREMPSRQSRLDVGIEGRDGQGDQPQPLAPGEEIVDGQTARALLGADVADREQPAKPPPGGAVLRIG